MPEDIIKPAKKTQNQKNAMAKRKKKRAQPPSTEDPSGEVADRIQAGSVGH